MIPVKHIDPDDLPLYAMQLLSPGESAEISQHLQHSPEARTALSEIYGDLAIFAHSAEMHSPPALARQRLMKHVARERKATPIAQPAPGIGAAVTSIADAPRKRSLPARVLPWVGWAVAAGLMFEVANLHQQRTQLQGTVASESSQLAQTTSAATLSNTVLETMKDPHAVNVVLTATEEKPAPQGRASYIPEKGSLVFLASNLQPLQPYKTYELWLIPADGRDPIPAGTFRPDARGNASVIMPKLGQGVAAKAFGVTIEDEAGAQSPTLPIILKGAAA